jgi:hypothetical protein
MAKMPEETRRGYEEKDILKEFREWVGGNDLCGLGGSGVPRDE